VLAAVLFLPLFLRVNVVELKLRGVALGAVWYHASGAVVAYLGLLLPVPLGAVVHSAALLLISSGAAERTRRIAAVALAALLTFTVMGRGPAAREGVPHAEKA
jgi:hypothetical protein